MNTEITMKTPTNNIRRGTALPGAGLTALLAGLALLSGCSPSPQPNAPGEHVYVGLDTSASWRPYLSVSATLCARQALRLNPDRDRLTLYRLDSSTREFSDGPAPDSGDRLQRTIVTEAARVSATRGTFPAKFWQAVTDRVAGDAGPVVVEAFTDGDNDDQTAEAQEQIHAAARRLADTPQVVSVSVFGAEPRNWATLRAEFAPLGDRFHLCSPTEMTADRVSSAMDSGQ